MAAREPASRFRGEARELLAKGSPRVIARLLEFVESEDIEVAKDACRVLIPFMIAKPVPDFARDEPDDRGLPRKYAEEELRVLRAAQRLLDDDAAGDAH